MSAVAGIYWIRNTVNGHRYIGQSCRIQKRRGRHLHALRLGTHENRHLQNAWNKYGEGAFVFEILAAPAQPVTRQELANLEQDYVDFFAPEYNIRRQCVTSALGTKRTAEYCRALTARLLGTRHTPEAKAKMSAAKKGRPASPEARTNLLAHARSPHTPEHRANISAALTGVPMSPERHARWLAARPETFTFEGRTHTADARARISNTLTGHAVSLETRAKLSAALKGRPRPPRKGGGNGIGPDKTTR